MSPEQLERAAYLAAHRILMASMSAVDLACPGARRSREVDTIASIIKDVFAEPASRLGPESVADPLVRQGVLVEFPRKASS
jgi:hypothetical protein